ncbi:MAG TPA: purine-nucleoside phosphorylase [Acidimicrobiales bacterium]
MNPPEPSSRPVPSPDPRPWAEAGRSAELIGERLGDGFDIAVVLGSGLGAAASRLGDAALSMADARFPAPTVPGHAGTILAGRIGSARVLVLAGRVHLYEGHDAHAVVHGVRTAARLGCRKLLLTNAAGGIRPDLAVGDLVAISDHLNLTGANPVAGIHDLPHGRFVDASQLYALAPVVAGAGGLSTGVYAALRGPTYETSAEIRMLATLGADLVGMSTALEALAAHALGLEVGALSLVTNVAAGLGGQLSHDEVTGVGAARADAVIDTIAAVCAALADPAPATAVASTAVTSAPAPAARPTRLALAARIDHTLLAPGATEAEIDELCAEASGWDVAAVCVSPARVALVAERSTPTGWKPCTVIAFPSGAHTPSAKEAEAHQAVRDGARELDMVVNLGAVADGAWEVITEEITLVRGAIAGGTLKVILETAALEPGQLEAVARLALDAGADFLKTSTGFHPAGGASVEAVAALAAVARGRARVKASGGIRDIDTALAMLAAGADRLGTSATGAILDGLG